MLYNIKKLKQLYAEGVNIIDYIKAKDNLKTNDIMAIQASYDIQAGSYRENFYKQPSLKIAYCKQLAKKIDKLGKIDSILLVGVGEAITLSIILNQLLEKPKNVYGIDISWSRIKYAKLFAQEQGIENVNLIVANLFELPFLDNSIDLVMSNHSLEPNGGNEQNAISELHRVARKYVLINEPSYEFGDETARRRIEEMGYVRNLAQHVKELKLNIINHELLEISMNPSNPTASILIKKELEGNSPQHILVCPSTKTSLEKVNDCFYTKDGMLAYPIIGGIPCLLSSKSIIATHFLD